ncbi:MAG: hypothetical protein J0L81_03915 [Caulobacterales bacterium]|jgi:hypothetical protein|nr:hypothetical protein [Caulobacterales bacterium]
MMRMMLAAVTIGLAAFAAPANAQVTGHNPNDLKCAVVGLTIAGTAGANAQQQQAGTLIALYYLGRVQGAEPAADLQALITREAEALTLATLETERMRCATEFSAMGQAMVRMGESMRSQ